MLKELLYTGLGGCCCSKSVEEELKNRAKLNMTDSKA
jgi:hypothetical protein